MTKHNDLNYNFSERAATGISSPFGEASGFPCDFYRGAPHDRREIPCNYLETPRDRSETLRDYRETPRDRRETQYDYRETSSGFFGNFSGNFSGGFSAGLFASAHGGNGPSYLPRIPERLYVSRAKNPRYSCDYTRIFYAAERLIGGDKSGDKSETNAVARKLVKKLLEKR